MTDGTVMPGDLLSTTEEYMPGAGTYERDGSIYAAVIGHAVFSEADKTVRVSTSGRGRIPLRGDSVVGAVTNVTGSLATVQVGAIEDGPCLIGWSGTGVIHVSRVTDSYTDDARKEFRVGDIVRARVEQAEPSLQLSTRDGDLGVLRALCMRCRAVLHNRGGELYCPDCDRTERRKLAGDFARYTPAHSDEHV